MSLMESRFAALSPILTRHDTAHRQSLRLKSQYHRIQAPYLSDSFGSSVEYLRYR